jgi:hypothetical protein
MSANFDGSCHTWFYSPLLNIKQDYATVNTDLEYAAQYLDSEHYTYNAVKSPLCLVYVISVAHIYSTLKVTTNDRLVNGVNIDVDATSKTVRQLNAKTDNDGQIKFKEGANSQTNINDIGEAKQSCTI